MSTFKKTVKVTGVHITISALVDCYKCQANEGLQQDLGLKIRKGMVREEVRQVRAVAAPPEEPSCVPNTHACNYSSKGPTTIFWPLGVHSCTLHVCVRTCTHTHTQINHKKENKEEEEGGSLFCVTPETKCPNQGNFRAESLF